MPPGAPVAPVHVTCRIQPSDSDYYVRIVGLVTLPFRKLLINQVVVLPLCRADDTHANSDPAENSEKKLLCDKDYQPCLFSRASRMHAWASRIFKKGVSAATLTEEYVFRQK